VAVAVAPLAMAVTTLDRQGRTLESLQPDPLSAQPQVWKSKNFERRYLSSWMC